VEPTLTLISFAMVVVDKMCRIANPSSQAQLQPQRRTQTEATYNLPTNNWWSPVYKFEMHHGWSIGYKNFTDSLLAFKKVECLPTNMFLKEDQDIEILRSHKPKWHDTCNEIITTHHLQVELLELVEYLLLVYFSAFIPSSRCSWLYTDIQKNYKALQCLKLIISRG